MSKSKIIKLALSIAVCLSVGFIGSLFTTPKISVWYAALDKPSFTPPNWLFMPVWTVLFIMMGVALFLIIDQKKQHRQTKLAFSLFVVQLLLNIGWSFIFFNQQQIFLALVEILILWLFIIITGLLFFRINRLAAYLLIPYLIWVSFAAILNYIIYLFNLNTIN